MTMILLTNDAINTSDFANCVTALNNELGKWATQWGIGVQTTALSMVKPDMIIKITETERRKRAYGFHEEENGIPVSYCSPRAVGRIYGHFTPARWNKAKRNLLGKIITPATLEHDDIWTQGLCTVIIHEAMEMLADAHLDKFALPNLKNEEWLVEVADHVSGYYSILNVNGQKCVIPDATFPSYYDVKGVAPFDLLGKSSKPFDQSSPHFYAYRKDVNGNLVKVV